MILRDFLAEFRTESGHLRMLERELQARPEPGPRDAELDAQTRRLESRRRKQALSGMLEASRSRWDVMNDQFEEVLKRTGATAEELTILRQFYGAAMTDPQIAAMLGRAPKTVCYHRLRWMHRAEEMAR